MIIGIGFGNLWTTLIMLLITGTLSYFLFRFFRSNSSRSRSVWEDQEDRDKRKARRRDYYYEQREKAREMFEKYNLSDEEIERIIEEELKKN